MPRTKEMIANLAEVKPFIIDFLQDAPEIYQWEEIISGELRDEYLRFSCFFYTIEEGRVPGKNIKQVLCEIMTGAREYEDRYESFIASLHDHLGKLQQFNVAYLEWKGHPGAVMLLPLVRTISKTIDNLIAQLIECKMLILAALLGGREGGESLLKKWLKSRPEKLQQQACENRLEEFHARFLRASKQGAPEGREEEQSIRIKKEFFKAWTGIELEDEVPSLPPLQRRGTGRPEPALLNCRHSLEVQVRGAPLLSSARQVEATGNMRNFFERHPIMLEFFSSIINDVVSLAELYDLREFGLSSGQEGECSEEDVVTESEEEVEVVGASEPSLVSLPLHLTVLRRNSSGKRPGEADDRDHSKQARI
jgi:hypothetical protein